MKTSESNDNFVGFDSDEFTHEVFQFNNLTVKIRVTLIFVRAECVLNFSIVCFSEYLQYKFIVVLFIYEFVHEI